MGRFGRRIGESQRTPHHTLFRNRLGLSYLETTLIGMLFFGIILGLHKTLKKVGELHERQQIQLVFQQIRLDIEGKFQTRETLKALRRLKKQGPLQRLAYYNPYRQREENFTVEGGETGEAYQRCATDFKRCGLAYYSLEGEWILQASVIVLNKPYIKVSIEPKGGAEAGADDGPMELRVAMERVPASIDDPRFNYSLFVGPKTDGSDVANLMNSGATPSRETSSTKAVSTEAIHERDRASVRGLCFKNATTRLGLSGDSASKLCNKAISEGPIECYNRTKESSHQFKDENRIKLCADARSVFPVTCALSLAIYLNRNEDSVVDMCVGAINSHTADCFFRVLGDNGKDDQLVADAMRLCKGSKDEETLNCYRQMTNQNKKNHIHALQLCMKH